MKKLMLFGGCVIGDACRNREGLEVVEHIGQSCLSSAFARLKFNGIDDAEIEQVPENSWIKRNCRRDLDKQARAILADKNYDAIVLDFIGEHRALFVMDGRRATISDGFWPVYQKKQAARLYDKGEMIGMWSFRRLRWWWRGLAKVRAIAKQKGVRVIVPRIYPAMVTDRGNDHSNLCHIKHRLWLFMLYSLSALAVKQIKIPRKYCLMATEHQWGGLYAYHYVPQYYDYLANRINRKVKKQGK